MRVGPIVLLAFASAACFEAAGWGWNSTVTSLAPTDYLIRYVPGPGVYDDPGPRYVFELPAGTRGMGLAANGWHGTLEILLPDCEVVGSIDLGGEQADTVVEEGGRPRAATASDAKGAITEELRPRGGTCGSPVSESPSSS